MDDNNIIDENNAIDQASLEPQDEQQFSFKVEGYEDEKTVADATEQVGDHSTDEGGVAELTEEPTSTQEQEEVPAKAETQEETVTEEEIIDVLDDVNTGDEPVTETETGLPDWIQKLVDFNADTGGGLEEYNKYNVDVDSLSDDDLLKHYYKMTKPHYSEEDIALLLDNKYGVDDSEELSQEDRLKLLAKKDEISEAKKLIIGQKDKYYSDLKSGVGQAPEKYKEAVQFYNDSQKKQNEIAEWRDSFMKQSKAVLNESFKGFAFEAGGKKFRLNAGDGTKILDNQQNLDNLLGEFLDDKGGLANAESYHKAIWAARNADKIFNSAYEQGKADALKERAKSTKNPNYSQNSGQSSTPQPQSKFKFIGNDFNNEW